MGGGLHRTLRPGVAGGGGAVGVVHPVQRPSLSDCVSAPGADQSAGSGPGRPQRRRLRHRGESTSANQELVSGLDVQFQVSFVTYTITQV